MNVSQWRWNRWMPASYPAELMAAVFISINVLDIFPADHQRAAEVLAKNLHAERGEKADGEKDADISQQLPLLTAETFPHVIQRFLKYPLFSYVLTKKQNACVGVFFVFR